MQIAIIGEGGREHALVWKTAQSPLVTAVFAIPGNAGTAQEPKTKNIPIKADALPELVDFCVTQNIDLCIIGPEMPLVLGLSDALRAKGIPCFGPSQAAARLEGSKTFSKAFLTRQRIPTASYASFDDLAEAKAYVAQVCSADADISNADISNGNLNSGNISNGNLNRGNISNGDGQSGLPIVIKADGLAAGKGVVIAETQQQAFAALDDMLLNKSFKEAGASVVIEAFLDGEEASFMCLADGQNVLPLASSQDHKAAYDGDLGPNSGGMGAYSPAPIVDAAMHQRIMETIIHPTLAGLHQEGLPYVGFLYAGVMIDKQGKPWVLEFNCRMGDPEAQVVLMRLESDLVAHCLAAVRGELAKEKAQWRSETALGVVLAAAGYPGVYASGKPIALAPHGAADSKLFYAGVQQSGAQLKTSGGRVLCACALGDSVRAAQFNAHQLAATVSWEGMWHRCDIGHRAIAREAAESV